MMKRFLRLYVNDPKRLLSIRGISNEVGISYSYVNRKIHEYIKAGFLKSEQLGRAIFCKPNLKNPKVITTLSEISIDNFLKFIEQNKQLNGPLNEFSSRITRASGYNIHCVILFGSWAKGKARKTSDIDLFVIVPEKKKFDDLISTEAIAINRRYNVNINVIISEPTSFVDMLKSGEQNVAKEVLKDEVVISGAEKFWRLVSEGAS